MNKKQGFSLIEIVVFIVVVMILAVGVLASFNSVLRGIPRVNYQATTMGYAIRCAEWFLGQRRIQGFDNITIGSVVPSFCNSSLPSGYSISTSVNTATYNNDSNYKIITTTVSGPRDLGYANVSVIVANY